MLKISLWQRNGGKEQLFVNIEIDKHWNSIYRDRVFIKKYNRSSTGYKFDTSGGG